MNNLRKIRKEKHMSQMQLALKLGVSQNTVSRYETEERQADYQTLIAIADLFDVTVDYLIGRTSK